MDTNNESNANNNTQDQGITNEKKEGKTYTDLSNGDTSVFGSPSVDLSITNTSNTDSSDTDTTNDSDNKDKTELVKEENQEEQSEEEKSTKNEEDNAENEENDAEIDTNEDKQEDKQAERDNDLKDLITNAGLDVNTLVEEITLNDGVTDDIKEKLKEKHGKAISDLIVDQLEGINNRNKEYIAANEKAIFGAIEEASRDFTDETGAEVWNKVETWAREADDSVISQNTRDQFNQALAGGGEVAKLVANELVNLYKNSDAFEQKADLLQGEQLIVPEGFQAISMLEYSTELDKLQQSGEIYGESNKIKDLQAKRKLSKKLGY